MGEPRERDRKTDRPLRTAATGTHHEDDAGTEVAPFLGPGQVLADRYEVRALLGRGGMGEVWHATDLKLRVEVALKALRPEYVENEKRRELLRSEVRTAREVVSPNVCRVYDLVAADDQELLSMEYVDGITLLELLKQRGPLGLREAGDLAAQFLAGLDAVHEAGLVHRDFKPENVMITRAGRVVLMDLGIAKTVEAGTGTVIGTPAYMAPEQLRGEAVDARTDVFAAGVVLAEMTSEGGIKKRETRESIWKGVREDPPQLPDSPWAPVLRRAVANDPRDRYPTARALLRALEEVTLRAEGSADTHPYPGLAAFTEADADHFFGRESEVEGLVRKLGRPRLLAIVGPSGAGKSSLLGAGLIPVLPEGWGHIRCAPGDRPFAAVARTLGRALSGDAEAVEQLVDFGELDVAVSLLGRWRRRHRQAVLILDQFEELFTLNAPEEQARFAELLGRLPIEADVHVLLSLRDDFLVHCSAHPPLAPMLPELTLLTAPQGAALRRALVQPALVSGFRFEDETLVDDMIGEVADERGALPLLAFAAARLWEKRDRETGLLTRKAYEEIGGVGGALAQHAEATLERIGMAREPTVRELFRNLVTAQGTRAIRGRGELLSVFEDRHDAEQVLRALVDARLITSFEVPGADDTEPSQRIEIIHESLLLAWPRLVRWQTQDADGAQLRDQLRQVAKVWEERGQPSDLLWTGPSYKEFEAWRERYSGGLSTTEEAFVGAMVHRAGQQRRRRTITVATAFALLVCALGLISSFWRAAVEARAVEKAKGLISLGRLELERDRTNAVAYALKSLETEDTEEGRRFAVEALSGGPVARVAPLELPNGFNASFSPDGRHYAVGDETSDLTHAAQLISRDGRLARTIATQKRIPRFLGDDLLLIYGRDESRRWFPEVWSIPQLTKLGDLPPSDEFVFVGDRLFHFSREEQGWSGWVSAAGPDGAVSEPLPPLPNLREDFSPWPASEDHYLEVRGNEVYLGSVHDWAQPPRRLGAHEGRVYWARAFSPDGAFAATASFSPEIRVWSTDDSHWADPLVRLIRGMPAPGPVAFQAGGSLLASRSGIHISLLDLSRPAHVQPVRMLREPAVSGELFFDPTGKWLATPNFTSVAFYPVTRRYPLVIDMEGSSGGTHLEFEPSGRGVVAELGYKLRHVPLQGTRATTLVIEAEPGWNAGVAFHPERRQLFVRPNGGSDGPYLLDLDSGERRLIPMPARGLAVADFAPDGAWVAHAVKLPVRADKVVHLVNVETGEQRQLGPVPKGEDSPANFLDLEFLADGNLVALEGNALRLWNLPDGSHRVVREGRWHSRSALAPLPGSDAVALLTVPQSGDAVLEVVSLADGTGRRIESHGSQLDGLAVDPSGTTIVTAGRDGVVRAGPIDGGEPHLLYGHDSGVKLVAVSPDGTEIASLGDDDGTLRVWPMPEGPPRHTLTRDELIARLRNLTNVRVVEDAGPLNGYSFALDPFPGWEDVPEW